MKASLAGLATLLLLTACGAGERSIDSMLAGGDVCPAGESCSSSTPGGLHFGRAHTDSAPLTIAMGGTQEIALVTARTGVILPDFDAKTTTEALTATVTPGSTVKVTGVSEGEGYLRIVDAGTDLLEDRFKLSVKAIDRVLIQPNDVVLPGGGDSQISVLGSRTVKLRVELRSADHVALADDGAAMEGKTPSLPWNVGTRWTMTARSSSGQTGSLELVVVDAIDDLVMMTAPPGTFILPIPALSATMIDGLATVCFDARSGGRSTVGVELTLQGSENLAITPGSNCAMLASKSVGPAWISAKAGGFTRRFEFEVVAAPKTTKSAAPRMTELSGLGTHLGERAASALVTELALARRAMLELPR